MMRSPACESWGKSGWHWCHADMGAVHIPSPQGLAMVSQGAGAASSLGRILKVMGKGETSGRRSFPKYLVWDSGDTAGHAPILQAIPPAWGSPM